MQRTPDVFKNCAKILVMSMFRCLSCHGTLASRGKVLSRFCPRELRAEIAAFLAQNNLPLTDLFSNSVWLTHVAYLADVFEQLNTLNVSMQGRGNNILNNMTKSMLSKKRSPCGQVMFLGSTCSPMPVMRDSNWTQQKKM